MDNMVRGEGIEGCPLEPASACPHASRRQAMETGRCECAELLSQIGEEARCLMCQASSSGDSGDSAREASEGVQTPALPNCSKWFQTDSMQ
jgi:hypothetical protein